MNWLQFTLILCLAGCLILTAACQTATSTGEAEQTAALAQVTTSPQPSPAVVVEPTPTPTPTQPAISEDNPITLTFWTVEEISSQSEDEAAAFFNSSLRRFERDNPEIEVDTFIKKASGKGGVLDFLRTSREAAPSVLPDVAVIPASDLRQAHIDGLLQSLEGRLDRSVVQDLLPASRRLGSINEVLVGVPLGLEMEHTIYNSQVLTGTPILWTDIFSKNVEYLFPAKGINGLVNDATLSQYLSAGGEFVDDEGTAKIDETALRSVLGSYERAQNLGIIDSSILEAATIEETWSFYEQRQPELSQISVRQYLTEREALEDRGFAGVPIQDEIDTPVAVIHGWLLVLITDDVNRQDAALRLIESFLSPANNATWNRIKKTIPTGDTAYQELAGDDPYWLFLTDQLNTAQPEPRFADYDRLGRIIQQAIEQVIRGEATSEEAAATAIDALAQ